MMERASEAVAHLRTSRRVVMAVTRNPALRRVELAYLAFCAVEFGTWVAILLYAYEATGPASIGVVAVALLLPAALVAPFAALLADRPDRVRSLAVGYLIQFGAYAATAIGILIDAPPVVVYLAAGVASMSTTLTRPTQWALLPELSRTPEELSAANGLSGTVEGGGVLVGPFAAALILSFGGPGFVFAAGALAMGTATALIVSLSMARRRVDAEPRGPDPATITEVSASAPRGTILDGLRVVGRDRPVRLVVTLLGLRSMVIGALDVLFVLLALEVFLTGEPGAAILSVALGVGMVVGGGVSFVLVGRRRLAPALAVAAGLIGGMLVMTALVGNGVSGPLLIVVAGIGFAASDVAGRTILQRSAQDSLLGRVLGTLESVDLFGLALGSILAPMIAAAVGVGPALAVAGLLLPISILIGWRGLRTIDRTSRVPARELALLGRSPVFAPLPPPDLETVARRVRWLAVDPGTAVITEGEPGDAYYVIEHGRFRVDQGGKTLRILDQPVQGFGEIALIRDVPRTATVTAMEPSVLLVVSRADFLAAVSGSQPVRAVLDDLVRDLS